MSKFNKPSGSFGGKRKPSFGSKDKPFRKERKEGESSDREEKKETYKSKRSFSKNKSFRKDQPPKRERSYDKPFKKEGSYSSDRKKSFDGDYKEKRSFDKPYRKDGDSSFKKNDKYSDKERSFKEKRSFDKPYKKDGTSSYKKSDKYSDKDNGYKEKRSFDRPYKKDSDSPFKKNDKYSDKKFGDRKERSFNESKSSDRKFSKGKFAKSDSFEHKRVKHDEFEEGRSFSGHKKEYGERFDKKPRGNKKKNENSDGLTRLNKYLANAGIASRREADTLIKSGVVKVNGQVVTEMGFKIKPGDTVTYNDSSVKGERKVYLLLNKPKDYITTVDDPQERKTVMELIEDACKERVYPVGRLDRNTTGLLLFTNDGELTKKLTHPRHEIKKVYHVSLNKGLKGEDFKAITEGIELEDGPIKVDDLAFVGEGKKEIGVEIHSGRNRIVRRIFEHLGYDVLKLDRVVFAGLTKKDLPRGKYRFLTPKEISFLHMIG